MQGISHATKEINYEKINMEHSLKAKKEAVLQIVRKEGKIIPSFGKRIAENAPAFYKKINTLYELFPPVKAADDPED